MEKGRGECFALRASAATDRDDDFQTVAAGKPGIGMLAARDDFAVFFDGDAFPRQVQRLDQFVQGKRRRKTAGFAVDDQFNHESLLLSETCKFQYHPEFYPEGYRYRAGVV